MTQTTTPFFLRFLGHWVARALVTLASTFILANAWASKATDPDRVLQQLQSLRKTNQNLHDETRLRNDFLNQLIFQVDTGFRGGSLDEFLTVTLKKMADRQPASPMYDFMMQASELFQEHREPGGNAIHLLQRYMKATSVLAPMPVKKFLATQTYVNGERSEYVKGLNVEALGREKPAPKGAIPVLKTVEIRD